MSKKKRIYSFLLVLFCGIFSYSQNISIKGTINDTEKKLQAGVTISILTSKNSIATFTITDKKGNYNLNFSPKETKLRLKISKFGYENIIQELELKNKELNFTLQKSLKETEIKEIVIKSSPIKKIGDTISYNIKSFADTKDRSIGDVLAKIPGIEVNGEGKILYQGRPIQKYYIEGLDLLEGKYNIANKNIAYDNVSAVQIIENHQPIKILDSLVPSTKASLNIKLKKNYTSSNSAKLSLGIAPLLWNANINSMLFTKKRQFIFTYQSNNNGEDLSLETKTLTLENLMEQMDNKVEKQDYLNITPLQLPNISNKRYLFNNTHLFTGNFLTKLKDETLFRVNVSYFNDYISQKGTSEIQYFLGTESISINESIQNELVANELKTDISIERNTKKTFFKNNLKSQINWDSRDGKIAGSTNVLQVLKNPYYSISNQLKWMTPIGEQIVSIYSFTSFYSLPQTLSVEPWSYKNNILESVSQNFTKRSIQNNTYLETLKKFNLFTLNLKSGLSYNKTNTASNLYTIENLTENNWKGSQENTIFKAYINPNLNFKKKKWRFSFSAPISFANISILDHILNLKKEASKIIYNTNLSINYDFNTFWKTNIGLGYSNDFENIDNFYSTFYLTNYRTFIKNNFILVSNDSFTGNIFINYRNPTKSLFFNTSYFVTQNTIPYISEASISENGLQFINFIPYKNTNLQHNLSTTISKSFNGIKTTFSLGFDYSKITANQYINSNLLASKNENLKPKFRLNSYFTDNFSVDYALEINFNKNIISDFSPQSNIFYKQNLKLNSYPTENQYIGLDFEHYYNDLYQDKSIFFSDFIYRYTLGNKKIDLEFRLSNIFNQKKYLNSYFNDYNLTINEMKLRPRQFITSIKFNF